LSPIKKQTTTMEPVVKVSWVSEDCRLTSGEAVEMVMRLRQREKWKIKRG
jgi:hypothetical protein